MMICGSPCLPTYIDFFSHFCFLPMPIGQARIGAIKDHRGSKLSEHLPQKQRLCAAAPGNAIGNRIGGSLVGDLQNEWHTKHGRRWPSWFCAGCEKPIGGLDSIDLADGNRVHVEPLHCMIEFGQRWRDTDSALVALGLESLEE
jgi:hypothetical protein